MKKILALILTALMLFSLIACKDKNTDEGGEGGGSQIGGTNNGGSGNGGSGSGTGSGGTSGGGTEGGGTGSGGTSSKEKIDLTKISDSTVFSEGIAWVRYGRVGDAGNETLYCINKSGEILFTYNPTVLNMPSPFYNGLSIILEYIDNTSVECIVDNTGKLIKPSDLGATEFLDMYNYNYNNEVEQSFKDGFIFAKKVETTFSGSTTKIAVFNSNMQKLIDYSEEMVAILDSYDCEYNNGFLCLPNENKYLDLKTNQIKTEAEYLIASAPERASDAWEYDSWDDAYYDPSTGTKMLDLSQYQETIYHAFSFSGGRAPLTFKSADTYYFTVIKEDGSFCFDPIEISTYDCIVKICGTKYLVRTGNWVTRKYITFNETGKISELVFDISESYSLSDYFNDDVIVFQHVNKSYKDSFYYYTLDFKPLF